MARRSRIEGGALRKRAVESEPIKGPIQPVTPEDLADFSNALIEHEDEERDELEVDLGNPLEPAEAIESNPAEVDALLEELPSPIPGLRIERGKIVGLPKRLTMGNVEYALHLHASTSEVGILGSGGMGMALLGEPIVSAADNMESDQFGTVPNEQRATETTVIKLMVIDPRRDDLLEAAQGEILALDKAGQLVSAERFEMPDNTIVIAVAMELAPRKSVKNYEKELAQLPVEQRFSPKQHLTNMEITQAYAEQLLVAAKQGIMHRDLKPDNATVNPAYHHRSRVIDWGLAEQYDTLVARKTDPRYQGIVQGTPNYMSPDVATGRDDINRDVYGLGLMAGELDGIYKKTFAPSNGIKILNAGNGEGVTVIEENINQYHYPPEQAYLELEQQLVQPGHKPGEYKYDFLTPEELELFNRAQTEAVSNEAGERIYPHAILLEAVVKKLQQCVEQQKVIVRAQDTQAGLKKYFADQDIDPTSVIKTDNSIFQEIKKLSTNEDAAAIAEFFLDEDAQDPFSVEAVQGLSDDELYVFAMQARDKWTREHDMQARDQFAVLEAEQIRRVQETVLKPHEETLSARDKKRENLTLAFFLNHLDAALEGKNFEDIAVITKQIQSYTKGKYNSEQSSRKIELEAQREPRELIEGHINNAEQALTENFTAAQEQWAKDIVVEGDFENLQDYVEHLRLGLIEARNTLRSGDMQSAGVMSSAIIMAINNIMLKVMTAKSKNHITFKALDLKLIAARSHDRKEKPYKIEV